MRNALYLFCALLLTAGNLFAVDYRIDETHSTIGFKIKHLAISSVSGRFTDFSGSFFFDPKNIAASKAEATISAESINTDQSKRDDHLRNSDFFDVEKFPTLSFKTQRIEPLSADSFKAHGELEMHGVKRPVVLDVKFTGAVKDPWGNQRAAFVATTSLNRKDFGLSWSKVLETGALVVGETVDITLEVEGIAK